MKLKYKDKEYDSEDVPLFIMFKTLKHKKNFINNLAVYKLGVYNSTQDIQVVLAGNDCLKDKRTKLYFCINDKEEKILNSLLNSVEIYINNLRDDRKKQIGYKEVTAKQKVVFWGHSSYSQVVLSSIDSAS